MALPTKEKTWQYDVNSVQYTSYPALLYNIKRALVTFGTMPWAVSLSSDSITAGAGDRWVSSSNVVWNINTIPHSWIVLSQAGLGGFQILLECWRNSGGQSTSFRLFCSPNAGFTGGTTSSRPTATDEIDLNCGGTLELCKNALTIIARLHVMQSTDGQCTRWVVCMDGQQHNLVAIEVPKSPSSGWSNPWVVVVGCNVYNSGQTTDWLTYARYNDLSTRSFARINSVTSGVYMACEGYGGATLGEQYTYPDDDTGEYPMLSVQLNTGTFGVRGANKGVLYDMWWGSTIAATGDTYPGDGTNQFAQFADVILPWNGSTPLVT